MPEYQGWLHNMKQIRIRPEGPSRTNPKKVLVGPLTGVARYEDGLLWGLVAASGGKLCLEQLQTTN